MATATPPIPLGPSSRRRRGLTVSTWLMLAPALAFLLLFFLAPLYYVFLFSVGLRSEYATKAFAAISGDLTSFSWQHWSDLLSVHARIDLLGLHFTTPLWALGIVELLLFAGAIAGGRVGGWLVGVSLVLLALPYLAFPLGDRVVRIAEIRTPNVFTSLFFKSISTSLTVSLTAVLFAFPVAYYLAFCLGRSKYTWLIIVIAPFLTSYLLRVLAFKVILSDSGLVNTLLYDTGVLQRGHPLSFLLYTQFTVLLVLLYAWVPFVALPIFIALENMDRRLLEAATDLGASRLTAFRRITLPLAAPGIVAAFLFVFIPTIGEFITPALIGGNKGYLYGNAIADTFGATPDWQTGATLALFMMLVVLAMTFATSRFLRTGGGAA